MSFQSILFQSQEDEPERLPQQAPPFFVDLNLDQIVDTLTAGREAYDLKPFFYAPLRSIDAVRYRQEVFWDLDGPPAAEHIRGFAHQMQDMRRHLDQAAKLRYRYQQEIWLLDAAEIYGRAVTALWQDLALDELHSRGLLAFRDFLTDYVQSPAFDRLLADIGTVKEALAGITYCLHIHGNRIHVQDYDSEPDYSAEVTRTFEKFQQDEAKSHLVTFWSGPEMNHVEAQVLDRVARLNPEAFAALDRFCQAHRDYLEATVARFDREAQFYLAYLEYLRPLRTSGLPFCYPQLSDASKEVQAAGTFDLALAAKLQHEHGGLVCNDFSLQGPERIFVITGPNQGGKTTFARTFGQLHHLARLGCLVPGSDARLFLADEVFTHFERPENLTDLRGKLQDELIRIRDILERATPRSVVIMNEIFTSTTLRDALSLSQKVLDRIAQLDLLCVCVTFVDELASLNEKTVSLVSGVDPDDQTRRTFKIERRPADGRAYAAVLAKKYGLTYERLKDRVMA